VSTEKHIVLLFTAMASTTTQSVQQKAWLLLLTVLQLCFRAADAYDPTWESLDSRPLPQWYADAKVGIFIHWGVFSVPSFGSEWFWFDWQSRKKAEYIEFINKTEIPRFGE
jgi:hypothetical protein